MKFLRHLRAAWLFYRVAPFIEEADEEGFWTDEDANSLLHYFSGYAGNKLRMRLNNYANKAACNAVRQQGDYAYNAGIAAGIAMGVGAITQHFPQSVSPSTEPESSEDGLDELIAQTNA